MRRRWLFYDSPSGKQTVRGEVDGCRLTRGEAARLARLMERVRDSATKPGDVKNLSGGIKEIRLQGDRRIFRLLYAELDGGLLLLGLHFFQKKSQQTPRQALENGQKRLADWRSRDLP